MGNYIFHGDPDPDKELEEEYIQFVMNIAAGQPVDSSLIVNGNLNNSRGGKGLGFTKFRAFFDVCREILLPNCATEERRHSDVLHASSAFSISDLKRQAIAILQEKVNNGDLDELPPVPDESWICLQFVSNVSTNTTASKFISRLDVKRSVQTRTLGKENIDQVGATLVSLILFFTNIKFGTCTVLGQCHD